MKMNTMNYSVIIVAGGKGTRTNLTYNKVFKNVAGRPLLEYSLKAFDNSEACTEIILVVNEEDYAKATHAFGAMCDVIIKGGKSRRESVYNGLKHVNNPYVMIHDGARPYVSKAVLLRVIKALEHHDSVSPSIRMSDTLKRVENQWVINAVDRDNLVGLQTPQAFKTDVIKKAHEMAPKDTLIATCDLSMVEETLNIAGFIVEGDIKSMKYTHACDESLLELILNDAYRTKS
jgi:2-C-methyl-D-erythritol 4-phosphate cytidylyltransferase